jgi:hypothetical protein
MGDRAQTELPLHFNDRSIPPGLNLNVCNRSWVASSGPRVWIRLNSGYPAVGMARALYRNHSAGSSGESGG